MMDEQDQKAPSTPATKMMLTLAGIAMLSGFLVVLVFQLTKPVIDENQRQAIERAVFKVVPGATIRRDYRVSAQGVRRVDADDKTVDEGITVYGAYDDGGRLLGIAVNGAGMGYAGLVHILYNYDPDCACIKGFVVLKSTETPGLGDKIVTDPGFLSNFSRQGGVSAKLNSAGNALENAIVTVKHGSQQYPWEIDAISGATITSKAVGKALNQSAQRLAPLLAPYLDAIKQIDPPRLQPQE
jgi:Na+-translocating ferredoxin:NAD+ oxidoreductase subunit G